MNQLETDKANLQLGIDWWNTTYYNYVGKHSHTDSEYETLKASKLIPVNLGSSDERPWFGQPYLHIFGEACNVGGSWAHNCKLYVIAYQSEGVIVIDTDVIIGSGSIYLEGWKSVDARIYYSGNALESWTITPEWTS